MGSTHDLDKSAIREEAVGFSNGLRNVFQMISIVAKADSTVLILGETGTGKELMASTIHQFSLRNNKPLVKLNCAVLPVQLAESELFGHEKGSFTGAVERRIGKFELAANGTLFLDEIGELSMELQSKLLRAIQEKEIIRVGGTTVIKTDVRLIAATNRDLKKEADEGKFREDLYYRLNVFPIVIPPLRERKDDIPILVAHFLKKISEKCGKPIYTISNKALRELTHYDWPGNVRELEHIIERSILMCTGNTITDVPLLSKGEALSALQIQQQFPSLEENERAYIISVLKKTNGKIRGKQGAADILKIPPTTLHSKIKKLGIRRSMN